jgi:type I restriction enzyme R subunit
MPTPEEQARVIIDQKLGIAGWVVQDFKNLNLGANLVVSVREFHTTIEGAMRASLEAYP